MLFFCRIRTNINFINYNNYNKIVFLILRKFYLFLYSMSKLQHVDTLYNIIENVTNLCFKSLIFNCSFLMPNSGGYYFSCYPSGT